MSILTEQIRLLGNDLNPSVMYQGDLPSLIEAALDKYQQISEDAIRVRNLKALTNLDALAPKFIERAIPMIDIHPHTLTRAVSICRILPEQLRELLTHIHNRGISSANHKLIDALVDNIITNESYYDIANARIARHLICDLMQFTDRPDPVIRLCATVAACNTKYVAGAGLMLSAIASIEKLSNQVIEESRRNPSITPEIGEKQPLINAVLSWIKASEPEIAKSIREGAPSEWTPFSAIEFAETKELPLLAAHLLTRTDGLFLPKLSILAKESGFLTDQAHIDKVLETHRQPNDPNRLAVIAYCLMHKDMLPDSIFQGDFPSQFANAALLMGDSPLHPVHGKAILSRLVEHLTPAHDISLLMKSHLHAELTNIRKYRGMMLELDLGM